MMKSNVSIRESYFGIEDLTRYGFITHMRDYIRQLLDNPLTANVDDYLKRYNIDNVKALDMIISDDNPILRKIEKIIKSEDGKDVFVIQYILPDKKNFKRKMRNLYIKNFEENIIKGCPIEEDCDGGISAAGDAQVTANAPIGPLNGSKKGSDVLKRRTMYITEEQLKQLKETIVNESSQNLKSKKLFNIFQQYGRPKYGKHWDSSEGMDLHNVTDNDVIGVFPSSSIPNKTSDIENFARQHNNTISKYDGITCIPLAKNANDGDKQYALVINRNAKYDIYSDSIEGGFKDLVKKQKNRQANKFGDGAKEYQWKDGGEGKRMMLQNPYYKDWSPESKERLQQKIKDTYKQQIDDSNEHLDEELLGGDFAYDAPCFADAPTMDHNNMMAKSWQGSMKKKIGARKKHV